MAVAPAVVSGMSLEDESPPHPARNKAQNTTVKARIEFDILYVQRHQAPLSLSPPGRAYTFLDGAAQRQSSPVSGGNPASWGTRQSDSPSRLQGLTRMSPG